MNRLTLRKYPICLTSLKIVVLSCVPYGWAAAQSVQTSSSLWQETSERSLETKKFSIFTQSSSAGPSVTLQRGVTPRLYRTFLLNHATMGRILSSAPREFTKTMEEANVQIDLPMPDGGFSRFLVAESPILPPNLARKYPAIRTYNIQGIDDPTATGRIELTPLGFRGIVLTDEGKGSYAIDPYWQNHPQGNISYYLKGSGLRQGDCWTPSPSPRQIQNAASIMQSGPAASSFGSNTGSTWGGALRIIRLAIACNGEFSQQVSGVTGANPGNLVSTLTFIAGVANRVSAIMERDFGLRFLLVDQQDQLTYLDPATDPFTPSLGFTNADILARETQATIDRLVGPRNYEFGHLFVASAGGSWGISYGSILGAVFGILGDDTRKAMCISARGAGNDVNFDHLVAHEMGHGLNANHTFSDRYEGTGAQVEPGSGSTIMSYAGATPTGNLQASWDGYYSSKSLEQMITYASSSPGNAAFQFVQNGNLPPVLEPLRDYTIPAQTPFALTAKATDPNGDTLTFSWEQLDSAQRAKDPALSPRDDGSSPLFRAFPPTTNPTRILPQLKYILENKNIPPPGSGRGGSTNYATGEFLPTTSRNMKFRVTVRDNAAGGGGQAFASCVIKSIAGSGPFAITNFNTSTELVSGAQQSLRWSVGRTGPGTLINCANVRISLSTNGGTNFTHVLAESATNNGVFDFIVPTASTTAARFKVEAVGNIFFDVSDTNLVIRAPLISNDLFAAAATLGPSLPFSTNGITSGATAEGSEPAHVAGKASSSVWFRWQPPVGSRFRVSFSTEGSNFDTVLAAYTGSSLARLQKVAANNDLSTINKRSRIEFLADGGQTYYLVIDGVRGETGTYVLTGAGAMYVVPSNDNLSSRANLGTNSNFTFTQSVAHATAEAAEPTLAGLRPVRSVWFEWTAPQSGQLAVHTTGSGFENVFGVYTGTSFSNLKLLQGKVGVPGFSNPVTVSVQAGAQYVIKVDGARSSNSDCKIQGVLTTLNSPIALSFTNWSTPSQLRSPKITWAPVSGATHYEAQILRNNNLIRSVSLRSPQTNWNNGPALPRSGGYSARVRAFSNNLSSDWTTATAVLP